ncbi:segregation and condensation protein A [Methylomarinovum caldicuralii]|uniref:Segregation and condensation protein A n=1 Tax=Methylomarinovum caldicuralii TaxID=438856 RepID=A0AAU9CEH1_9GAMM|nr:ScpA family protein [Methylomarinovum caldicuralii]BCX83014.1 segregation and condensation protein A [Methylomarinovum caldicuralii]
MSEATILARVRGAPVVELPENLYIPPDALRVILEETFEGPLDLLLYLIRRQNLDIMAVSITRVTEQYLQYIGLMERLKIELAAEYLLMAAWLAEIKSRLLLPKPETEGEDEEDPRAELVRRLQEYERIKQAAQELDALPRLGRDLFPAVLAADLPPRPPALPQLTLEQLAEAFRQVLDRAEKRQSHTVPPETLSVRERMSQVLARLRKDAAVALESLFDLREGRAGLVVTFLALLELCKEGLVEVLQSEPLAPIRVQAR